MDGKNKIEIQYQECSAEKASWLNPKIFCQETRLNVKRNPEHLRIVHMVS